MYVNVYFVCLTLILVYTHIEMNCHSIASQIKDHLGIIFVKMSILFVYVNVYFVCLTQILVHTHIEMNCHSIASLIKDHLGIIFVKMILACSAIVRSAFIRTILWRFGQCLDTNEKNVLKIVIFEKEHLPCVSPKILQATVWISKSDLTLPNGL